MTDLPIAAAFALIILLWQIADSRHRRRYPAGNQQRGGDTRRNAGVGQVAAKTARAALNTLLPALAHARLDRVPRPPDSASA